VRARRTNKRIHAVFVPAVVWLNPSNTFHTFHVFSHFSCAQDQQAHPRRVCAGNRVVRRRVGGHAGARAPGRIVEALRGVDPGACVPPAAVLYPKPTTLHPKRSRESCGSATVLLRVGEKPGESRRALCRDDCCGTSDFLFGCTRSQPLQSRNFKWLWKNTNK
jgi:hypothetical protein